MSQLRKTTAFQIFVCAGAAVTLGLMLFLHGRFRIQWLPAYLAGVNSATFLLYFYDKLASRRTRKWLRAPERILHLFAFIGGTPSAFVAQKFFRHKTIKARFRAWFWILAIAQIALIIWAVWYWG